MFLTSLKWKKFQESAGREVFNIGDGFLIKIDLPLGKSYLYSNYLDAPSHIKEIKKIGRTSDTIFFKWEPMITSSQQTVNREQEISKTGFLKAKKELQPQKTIILDLNKEEKEILSDMHKKTRYNIRLAKKRGVKVSAAENSEENFNNFWNLISKTAKRDNFKTHTKDYYKKLLEVDGAKLYFAQKEKEIYAAAIVLFAESRATYLHGASDYRYRRDMAPYLLHWKIIKDAKDAGIKEYDLWGIDEKKWPGVTRFKRGFGGREIEYIGSWDIPINNFWYKLYLLKNKLK